MLVGDHLLHNGQRVCARRFDFANDTAEIKRQLGVKFTGELLHAAVVGKTRHVQLPKASVAGGKQRSTQQRRADAVTLPRLFDTDRGFGLTRKTDAKLPQLGSATQNAIKEKTVHDRFKRNRQIDEVADKIVGYAAAEPVMPA